MNLVIDPLKGLVELARVNARSISNNILDFQEYISSKNVDVCAVTETWLMKDDALTCKQIPPPGYKIHLVPRQDGHQGGGIAIVYKDCLTITKITEGNQLTMEFFLWRLQVKQKSYELLIVYKAPNTSVLAIIGDLIDLLEQQVTY